MRPPVALEHLAKVARVEPATASRAPPHKMLGLVLRRLGLTVYRSERPVRQAGAVMCSLA
jgi:hypothetical protein